jgi:hypothetical protein
MNTTPEPEPGTGPEADTAPPPPGTAVRDTTRDRVGIVMGNEGPYLQLRPLSGGREWDAHPARIQPLDPAELLRARVAEANACSRRTTRERIELPQIDLGGDPTNDEIEDIVKGMGPFDTS